MPKKRRTRRDHREQTGPGPDRHSTGTRRWERDVEALLAQFVLSRRDAVSVATADSEASHVEQLLRLKAEQLESPDPTYWTGELIEVLLTEVAPRKVVQPREMVMAQGPALGQFLGFLQESGRRHPDGLTADDAQELLAELEFTTLEAADDPSRRTFSGNILTYAQTLGVELDDAETLEDFMTWYNTELTVVERHELSDTGQLRNPSRPYIPGARSPALGAGSGSAFFSHAPAPEPVSTDPAASAGAEALGWPWFLPQDGLSRSALESSVDVDEDPVGAAAVYAEIPLVRGAVRLLEHVGEGRRITSTGALRMADVRALVEAWQLDLGEQKLTTMWQVGPIVGPWNALVSGGWLELSSTRVTPGQGLTPAVPQTEDPAAFVRFSRALLMLLILDTLQQGPEGGGLFGGPDTFAALMHTIAPGGLALPATIRVALDRDLVPADLGGDPDMDEIQRYWQTGRDLAALATYGLLVREASPDGNDLRFHGTVEVIVEAFGALEMQEEYEGLG
ncbi:MAG: hypothetical protein ACTMII_13120 [Brachybacterium sp.]|uniref:hypothetical protein n=1 Tax=unclassified Brachybacterium TaxID=2623841 RepID=UPI003F926AA0